MTDQPQQRVHHYGIDPGSSKPWAVHECSFPASAGKVEECLYREWEIEELDGLIDQIVGRADRPVLLSIDAPLNRTSTFQLTGGGGNPTFPFNTNPFTVRPCERALTRLPQVLDRNLRFSHLADMIAALCGWQRDYSRAAGNRSFVELHEGVSVLGYMTAPHGPVVSLFLRRLAERHPALSFSPREACRPLPGRVYVLESHPAVSLGVWTADGQLGEVATVPRYKSEGDDTLEGGLHRLRGQTVRLATEGYGFAPPVPRTDDELDALVGLLNLLDLVAGRGDWFGCEALGYFLIPRFGRYPQGDGRPATIGEAWEAAFCELAGAGATTSSGAPISLQ